MLQPRVAAQRRTLGNDCSGNIAPCKGTTHSSKWIKKENVRLADYHWQNGYGAFSVSPSHMKALIDYIANQEEHHCRETFQEEFRRLCRKCGVEIDERYVWG